MILSDQSRTKILDKMAKYPHRKSALLPALTIACLQEGHLNDNLYREISELINIPYVEIAEAATFYTLFPKKPVGKYHIMVCHNISCALVGADSMIGFLEEKLGIKKGETTADGLFSLHSVECLASCSTAPMVQINQDYYENLTADKLSKVIDDLRGKA